MTSFKCITYLEAFYTSENSNTSIIITEILVQIYNLECCAIQQNAAGSKSLIYLSVLPVTLILKGHHFEFQGWM